MPNPCILFQITANFTGKYKFSFIYPAIFIYNELFLAKLQKNY